MKILFFTTHWLWPCVTISLYCLLGPSNLQLTVFIITNAWQHCQQLFPTFQSDELSLQKKLRTEVIQLEDTLAQVRKEYEMLRIEFEQNLAANEQAGKYTNKHPSARLGRGEGKHVKRCIKGYAFHAVDYGDFRMILKANIKGTVHFASYL